MTGLPSEGDLLLIVLAASRLDPSRRRIVEDVLARGAQPTARRGRKRQRDVVSRTGIGDIRAPPQPAHYKAAVGEEATTLAPDYSGRTGC